MRQFLLTLILCWLGTALSANELLSGDDFERRYEGKTLHFGLDGEPFGSEQFLPGRKSVWKFTGDDCANGVWFTQGAQICFLYEGLLEQQCWLMIEKDGKLFVRSMGQEPGMVLELLRVETKPLVCNGPDVGV